MAYLYPQAFTVNATKRLFLFAVLLLSARHAPAAGPAPIDLKSAAPFTILATSTTTTAGGGVINGEVGLSPFGEQNIPPGQINGAIHNGDAIALQAKNDLNAAFNAASPGALPGGINAGAELGGLTLAPGVYTSPSTAYTITSVDLTLNGGPNDVWVFQMGTSLTVGVGRSIILTGGAQARNIFWQVGSSATLNTSCVFAGTILAANSITMNASSTLNGRALAENGQVAFNGSGGALPDPAPPVFAGISVVPTNSAILVLDTAPYFLLTLQTSSNLFNWTTIATNTPSTNVWMFTNSAPAGVSKRFYQAFITPYP